MKRDEVNQDAGHEPAAYPREEEMAMSSQEEDRGKGQACGGCVLVDSDSHAHGHSAIRALRNLSLLDFATQQVLVDRPLKLGQPCIELFLKRFHSSAHFASIGDALSEAPDHGSPSRLPRQCGLSHFGLLKTRSTGWPLHLLSIIAFCSLIGHQVYEPSAFRLR